MGGFAALLGHAASGYNAAHEADTQRQFADLASRRAMAGEILSQIALDPNQHPEVRNLALRGRLGLSQEKPTADFNTKKYFDPLLSMMAKYRQPQGQQGAANQPPAPPPGLGIQGVTPVNANAPALTAQGPAPAGGVGLTQQSSIEPPSPTPSQQMMGAGTQQYTPQLSAPPQPPANIAQAGGLLAGVPEIAQNAATMAGATAGGSLKGQIAARKQAIAGMNLPPEQEAAFTLGMPAMVGSYGRGDVLPASEATRMGVPVPSGIGPNDWIRVQRGKMGNIVGVFPAAMPPAYAPTEHEGFVQVQQLDGTIKEVPVTTISHKELPGQSSEKPTAKVGEGRTVGGKAPTPITMIAPPTQAGGQPQAVAVRPGGSVPTGAVTTAGYSSVSVPTSGTRTRSEFATGLIPAIDHAMVDVQHAAPKLGALKGRYNEWIAGILGGGLDDDPQISALRTEIGLLQTGMMVPHVGARGGVQLVSKFKNLIDSGKASAPQLNAALMTMRRFLVTYANEGRLKGWGNEPMDQLSNPPAPPAEKFDINQFPVIK